MYIDELPKWAQRRGRAADGDIEILDPPEGTEDCYGIVFRDDYVTVIRDRVRFPNGEEGSYVRVFEAATLKGATTGVVVIPMQNRTVILNRTFRHALRRWELEFPRGYCDPGETPVQAAKRELAEETGLRAVSIRELGTLVPNGAILASEAQVFVAELTALVPKRTGTDEAIDGYATATADTFPNMVSGGQVRDALTIAAWQLYLASEHASS